MKVFIEQTHIKYAMKGLLEYAVFLVEHEKAVPGICYTYQEGSMVILKHDNPSLLQVKITVFKNDGQHFVYVKDLIKKDELYKKNVREDP